MANLGRLLAASAMLLGLYDAGHAFTVNGAQSSIVSPANVPTLAAPTGIAADGATEPGEIDDLLMKFLRSAASERLIVTESLENRRFCSLLLAAATGRQNLKTRTSLLIAQGNSTTGSSACIARLRDAGVMVKVSGVRFNQPFIIADGVHVLLGGSESLGSVRRGGQSIESVLAIWNQNSFAQKMRRQWLTIWRTAKEVD